MKYIIEIEDEPLVRKSALHGEDAVYRAKGFKSLVFDKAGLEKLTPYNPETQEQKDKEDVFNKLCEATGLADEEIADILGRLLLNGILTFKL